MAHRFGILVVLYRDLNLRKNEKDQYLRKNVNFLGSIFHGLCLIGYKSVNCG